MTTKEKCKLKITSKGIASKQQVYENYCKTHKYKWNSFYFFSEDSECPKSKLDFLKEEDLKNET